MAYLTGYDACDYRDIPRKIGRRIAVFPYLDGPCKWPAEAFTAFRSTLLRPVAGLWRITTEANELAEVFDWEAGTAPLALVNDAIAKRSAAYLPSVVYVSLSKWDDAKAAVRFPVAWWVADWTGRPHLPEGASACQFTSFPSYDQSVLAPGFPQAV